MTSNLNLLKINRFVLNKQRLTSRKQDENIVETVRDIGGLHATSATTPYLSLFARVKHFRKEHLDNELYKKRTLGKIRYVRTTVYVLPKDLIPTAFAATKATTQPASEAYSRFLGITEKQYSETSRKIVDTLKNKKGMTARQIKQTLETSLNISPIVNLMCDQGILIRGPPEKGWKSNIHTYYLLNEYFPDMKLNTTNEKDARKTVVRQYLASFGPTTENDIAWWTGFPKNQIKQITQELNTEIAHIAASDNKAAFLALTQDEAQLKITGTGKEQTVNMLPCLDPYLMGYKDRERYLEPEHYNYIFDRSGNATSTILLDGKVIGIWDFEKPYIKTFLFNQNKTHVLKAIRLKALSLGNFISGSAAETKQCSSMTPLTERTAGGVMSPLRGS